jgi:hypothetical protein
MLVSGILLECDVAPDGAEQGTSAERKCSTAKLSGGGPPSWIRTNVSRLKGEVTALCSVGSGWRMVRRTSSFAEGYALMALLLAWFTQRGCLASGGFRLGREPLSLLENEVTEPFSAGSWCSTAVQSGELARTEGFEPPPSGFVIRRIIQFCYVRVVGFRPQVTVGNWWRQPVTLRPRRSCKDRLHPCAVPVVGAWGTYRACSSRFSVGCNDLICHPGFG